MFCLNCGKEIDNSAMKCPYCNSPTENAMNNSDNFGSLEIESSVPNTKNNSCLGAGIISIILGVMGFICSIIYAIRVFDNLDELLLWFSDMTLILACPGLMLGLFCRSKNSSSKTGLAGIIFSSITLAILFIVDMVFLADIIL